MGKLSALLHIIDVTSEWVGKIVSFAIVLIIGTIVWFVLVRYVFHNTTAWGYGTAIKFFLFMLFLEQHMSSASGHMSMWTYSTSIFLQE